MKKFSAPVIIISLALTALAVWGGFVAFRGDPGTVFYEGDNPALPVLDIYTSGGATTPQLALFAAIREGDLRDLFNFRIHIWKNPDDLLSNVMSGKGDLWIGHTEGFAVARMRGAPVQMLIFTSFHKFYILTSVNVTSWEGLSGSRVAYAPPGSPAFALMRKVMEGSGHKLILEPYQGKELELQMVSGKVRSAILPEPLVTQMLAINGGLKIIAGVEDLFSAKTGEPVPVAGIGVNENTARKYRDKIAKLQKILLVRSEILSREGKKAARYFPGYFDKYLPRATVEQSLVRDTISSVQNSALENALAVYLNAVYPDIFKNKNTNEWCRSFLWQR